ncbi:MAG: hypothetical protein SFZ03_02850 [Candidatus Melainabacteria bacterium]|nr:hypothetical protein [Candidatus Melainabacteria bacterium]
MYLHQRMGGLLLPNCSLRGGSGTKPLTLALSLPETTFHRQAVTATARFGVIESSDRGEVRPDEVNLQGFSRQSTTPSSFPPPEIHPTPPAALNVVAPPPTTPSTQVVYQEGGQQTPWVPITLGLVLSLFAAGNSIWGWVKPPFSSANRPIENNAELVATVNQLREENASQAQVLTQLLQRMETTEERQKTLDALQQEFQKQQQETLQREATLVQNLTHLQETQRRLEDEVKSRVSNEQLSQVSTRIEQLQSQLAQERQKRQAVAAAMRTICEQRWRLGVPNTNLNTPITGPTNDQCNALSE